MKKVFIIVLVAALMGFLFIGIYYFGSHYTDDTLGGFPERNFPVSKENLDKAIDNLFLSNPEFKVPNKWADEDTSIKKSYFFLEGKTFYFKNNPEEMYYVTFIGDSAVLADSKKATISIRLINNGGSKWLRFKEVDTTERKRIEKRFDAEIIGKLENYTGTKSFKSEDDY
jgi:hypothetical protein